MKTKLYRHGEIAFVKIDKLPVGLKETKTNEIVKGSHGNSHTFKGGKIYLKKVDDYVFGYLKAQDTKLYHAEHGYKKSGSLLVAELPNGVYELRKQMEFINSEMKQVID